MRRSLTRLRNAIAAWKAGTGKETILGHEVHVFEHRLAEYCGSKKALTVASGTDALIISLKALDIKPDDEVIVPALGFFSTASAVAWVNARPVFVDINIRNHTIDENKIEAAITKKTKAIIPVHIDGNLANITTITQIAKKHHLHVITDAAQAIGSSYKGKPIGNYTDAVCLSFNPTKLLSGIGDGGAILTNNIQLANKIDLIRMYGAPSWEDIYSNNKRIGIASRMNSFQASILNSQLSRIDSLVKKQQQHYYLYHKHLVGLTELTLPQLLDYQQVNGYRYVVKIRKRDKFLQFLKSHGVEASVHYPKTQAELPAFRCLKLQTTKLFPVADKISRENLTLPTSPDLKKPDILRITNTVRQFFNK